MVLTTLAVLAVVELASRTGALPRTDFPPVTEDVQALVSELGHAGFWQAAGDTLVGWGVGLGIAVALAVPLGIAIGALPLLHRATRPIVEFLRPVPSVAILPLVVLVFGPDLQGKLFLVAFAAFWPVLVQTIYGVQDTDPVALDTARSFGCGRLTTLARITLPSALPYVVTGVRISSAIALVLAVTAEMVMGAPGLGNDITVAQSANTFDVMYGLIIAAGLIGVALNGLLALGERRALHWHPSQRVRRSPS
jgi:ABC-type nitrate/sulfonate/bicarbonate transport system permease component